MAITFNRATTVQTGTNVTIPGIGSNTGDLAIIVTTGSSTPTTPTSFTLAYAQGSGNFLTVFYRLNIPSGGVNVSVSGLGTNGKATGLFYAGVTFFDTVSVGAATTATTIATNTLTTIQPDEYVISAYAANNGATKTWTIPASTTNRSTSSSSATANGLLLVDELKATAGVTTARTATISASSTLSAVSISIIGERTLYWVGGSGTWSTLGTVNWSNTSGGASGAPAPSNQDTVVFNSSSGSPTVTLDGNPVCKNWTIPTGTHVFSFTTKSLDVYGNITIGTTTASFTSGATGQLNILGASTITSFGRTFPMKLSVGGEGSTTFSGAFTNTSSAGVDFLNSDINISNITFTAVKVFLDSTNVNYGTTGNITLTGNAATLWNSDNQYFVTGTATVNLTYSGSVGTRTITTFSNLPTTDFNITAGSDTVSFSDTSPGVRNLNTTGFSGQLSVPNASSGRFRVKGNLTLASNTTYNSNFLNLIYSPAASTTVTFIPPTTSLPFNIEVVGDGNTSTVNVTTNTLTLGSTQTLTLTRGILNTTAVSVSTGFFNSSVTTDVRQLQMGSVSGRNWTIAGASGNVWNVAATNLTLTSNLANIILDNSTASSTRTFVTGGRTYNTLTIGAPTAASQVIAISGGGATFGGITSTKTVAWTLRLPSSVTTTFNSWSVTGTAGNFVSIRASTTGTQATIAKGGGGTVTGIDYLNIQDSAATPADTWYAGDNSINSGNNTGWILPPQLSSNFFLLF